jgi:hypothetical protein
MIDTMVCETGISLCPSQDNVHVHGRVLWRTDMSGPFILCWISTVEYLGLLGPNVHPKVVQAVQVVEHLDCPGRVSWVSGIAYSRLRKL